MKEGKRVIKKDPVKAREREKGGLIKIERCLQYRSTFIFIT